MNLMNFSQNQYSFLSTGARSEALAATKSSLKELQSSDECVQRSTSENASSDEGKVYTYGVTKDKALSLIGRTRNWLQTEGFEVQEVSRNSDQIVFQIRKNGAWRKVAGMQTALRIEFAISENKMKLSMKSSKWSTDKSIAMTAGWFVFAPLCATAAYGILNSIRLPQKLQILLVASWIDCDVGKPDALRLQAIQNPFQGKAGGVCVAIYLPTEYSPAPPRAGFL